MIHDLDELGQEDLAPYDLCVVGSGPAGMTVAAELRDAGLRVCVLESGRERPTRRGDAQRKVVSEGITIKDWSRERVLGGASSTWAGLSAPLDPVDLEPRPWSGQPGWPLSREELLPFWEQAAARYRFAPPAQYGSQGFGTLRARGDVVLSWQRLEEKIFLAASEPQHFGREWKHLFRAPDMDLLLDATVLRLETDGRAAEQAGPGVPRPVRRALAVSRGGRRIVVAARIFVLATGGLENARLLLASRDACPAGLGNEHDQVGRHLMNHPKSYHGILRLARPVRELPYLFGCLHGGYAGYAGLRLTEDLQRERRLLNSYVRFEPLYPWSDNPGVEALVLLVKHSRGLFRRWKERQRDEVVTLRDYSETGDDSALQNERRTALGWLAVLGLVLRHLPMVLRYVVARVRRGPAPPVRRVRLRNFMEMEPHPDNRVVLGEDRDPDGQPLTVVRHDTSDLDRRSLVALHEVLASELEHNGFGTLESDLGRAEPWPVDQDASHHMGTTRMGDDPAVSVVDAHCRVHSVANLYLAGASVFPTSGCANPTLTIVALSIRLAAHLRTVAFGLPPRMTPRAGRRAGTASGGTVGRAVARPGAPCQPAPGGSPAIPGAGAPCRVAVVGAGRRVREDVLPALTSLAGRYEVASVWATGARTVEVAGHAWEVEPLAALDDAALEGIDLLYLAVSKAAVPAVLGRLLAAGAGDRSLLVDTPVLLFKHLHHAALLERFAAVWAPEDCATLPWLPLVARACGADGPLGALQEVHFDRSAWRYHAFALMKTLLGCADVVAARRQRIGGGATRVEVALANGTRAVMLEPRDYAAGHLRLQGSRGLASDERGFDGLRLSLQVEGARCTGFTLGELHEALSPEEAALLGPVHARDTVTSRMDDLKRVGLRRLLVDVHDGRGGYPVQEALDDMVVDHLLEKLGRWRAWGPLSVKAASGRRVLGGVTRMLGR